MSDSRVRDFAATFSPTSKADYTGVFTWVDKAGWPEAQKWEAGNILSEAVVTDNSNNYQALTPKAFYDSIATEARRGVVELANDTEIQGKTTTNALSSNKQGVMQTQWRKDWFENEAVTTQIEANNFTTPSAMSFNVNFQKILSVGNVFSVGPVLPSGYRFRLLYFRYVVELDPVLAFPPGVGTEGILIHTGAQQEYVLLGFSGGTDLAIRLSADGTSLSIYCGNGTNNVWKGSLSFNAIIEAI